MKPKTHVGYREVIGEDVENALQDYTDASQAFDSNHYRCRDCGLLFDTLEEHDRHHRRVHGLNQPLAISGMQG
ncbi:MAG: hypothetical protein NWE93_04355 [Candidatus Bathyarchaeota archaeon]|nr:hypothetical protein [Candidatus Bathyarchaeota archaeon]